MSNFETIFPLPWGGGRGRASGAAVLFFLLLALLPARALAGESPLPEAQRAQLESLRAEVAAQVQLQAYDLLDELVFGWIQQPVFALETPVVLADVTVPVGFGSGMQALIETHFFSLAVKNPRSHIAIAHCPNCSAMVVHSTAKGTIVSRGVDQPEALAASGTLSGSRHALFLDFEIEGSALVLRARITSLSPTLPIVYARTLSTSTSSPALLRSGTQLKSAADARQEYVDALRGRGLYIIPLRVGVRSYAAGDSTVIKSAPFGWLQIGVETSLTNARAWNGSFSLGFSWAPELHAAMMANVRISRLLSGTVHSLTRPDFYLFTGASVIYVRGQSALVFQDEVPDLGAVALTGIEPSTSFGALQVGLEARVKNRIGMAAFIETMPALNDAPAIGTYSTFPFNVHTIGAEVSFCF